MLTHGDTSYTWTQGRKLASVVKNGVTSKYLYDHTGMRVSKTVDGVETRYRYAGRLLLSEKTTGGKTLFFRYDSASNLISMTYNSNVYIYVKNLQGDIWIVTVAIGIATQYVGDVIGNLLAGKTGIESLIPTSSVGEYVAAGVTALIPGAGITGSLIRNVVSETIISVERHINGDNNDLTLSTISQNDKIFSVKRIMFFDFAGFLF